MLRMDSDGSENHEKKAWKGSLLLDFGHEVGETLNELELEYDEMIVNFENQKSRLKGFAPQESTIQEDAVRSASPALSDASSNDHSGKRASFSSGGLKSTFRNAHSTIKRKLSNRGSSSSQRTSPRMVKREQKRGSEDFERHDKSETSSLNSEVFAKEEAVNGVAERKDSGMDYPLPMAYDQHRDSAGSSGSGSRLSVALSGKPPISPGKMGIRLRSSTVSTHNDHVITPPVVIDGEVKRDYQYVSPARRVSNSHKGDNKGGIFRSSSFAKILGRQENGSPDRSRHSSREESPLKALYKATVLGESNNKENQNNHNNAALLRMYKCTT